MGLCAVCQRDNYHLKWCVNRSRLTPLERLRVQRDHYRAALELIAELAGSNTVAADVDPPPHTYGGLYLIARRALAPSPVKP